MIITAIPAFKDNYIWIWYEEFSKLVWVVDPGDANPVITLLERQKWDLGGILITHHHHDHTGGVNELVKRWQNIPVYGSCNSPILAITKRVSEGDEVLCGTTSLKVMEIPGHTLDHIAFYNNEIIFCGDTLFSAGCGRVFEGTPIQMYQSLTKIMQLPENIYIYCAHEYTLANLKFAQLVEPHNSQIKTKIEAVLQLREANKMTLPSTLSAEKQFNPFLRCEIPEVIQAAEKYINKQLPAAVDVFATLRDWKNSV